MNSKLTELGLNFKFTMLQVKMRHFERILYKVLNYKDFR